MCYGLVELRGKTFHDVVAKVVVLHLGTDIQSIDIIQVFWYNSCLFEITNLVDTLSGLQ